jgi:gamma-glutamyltranspeptidase/glutathione hydrolase
VEKLLSKSYAADRRGRIDRSRARAWAAEVAPEGSPHTTHVTVADGYGNVVASTQTINSLFGARYFVPGTGMIPNNYMFVFDPRPGRASSVAAGKRVTSSMAPVIVLRDGKPVYALGLPGGLRIFPSVMQALSNLIDHGMSVQEAVEAPRVWTQGNALELEGGIAPAVFDALRDMGHDAVRVGNVAGGMSAIRFHDDGVMEGASCWRADGTPVAVGGGLARAGVRFRPEVVRG